MPSPRIQAISNGTDTYPITHALLLHLSYIPITPFLVQEYTRLFQQYFSTTNQLREQGWYVEILSELVCVAVSQALAGDAPQVNVHRLERIMRSMEYESLAMTTASWWERWFYARRIRGRYYNSKLLACRKGPTGVFNRASEDACAHLKFLIDRHHMSSSGSNPSMQTTSNNPPLSFTINLFERAHVTVNSGATLRNSVPVISHLYNR
ncbi:hypothetical protein AX16_006102 [Volvariella volvacea WC 439]|nr:hypothetical protein AX16_006102 [Volvariella volvacea WC 439]